MLGGKVKQNIYGLIYRIYPYIDKDKKLSDIYGNKSIVECQCSVEKKEICKKSSTFLFVTVTIWDL